MGRTRTKTTDKTSSKTRPGAAITRRTRAQLVLPTLVTDAGDKAQRRFVEFFTARIRNPNTRAAYMMAWKQFAQWCTDQGLTLEQLEPVAVAAYIEVLGQQRKPSTVKQHLAAIRMICDYLVTGGVLPLNPARSVEPPKESVRRGKTPTLFSEDLQALFESLPTDTVVGLRDRALLGTMYFTFARVGALVKMDVRHYRTQGKRAFFELQEKGGKWSRIPAHHLATEWMDVYLEEAGIGAELDEPLWRTTRGRSGVLTDRRLQRREVLYLVKRRCEGAGLPPDICDHSFRAAGITSFLSNGGSLEAAAYIAGHASTQTTQLYDRRAEDVSLSEIERIRL